MIRHLFFLLCISFASPALANIQMAITVDDLPATGLLPKDMTREDVVQKMLKTLQENHIPEVYGFINAGQLQQHPEWIDILKMWRAAGYPLGNHTYSHLNPDHIPIGKFIADIEKNEPVLEALSGDTNWKYLRYPYLQEGGTPERIEAIRGWLQKHGYTVAGVGLSFSDHWTNPYVRCVDSGDDKSLNWLKEQYLRNAVDALIRMDMRMRDQYGHSAKLILLLHINPIDAEMLPALIDAYRKQGVQFIPLSEAVKDPVYKAHTHFRKIWMKAHTFKDGETIGAYTGFPDAQLATLCQ